VPNESFCFRPVTDFMGMSYTPVFRPIARGFSALWNPSKCRYLYKSSVIAILFQFENILNYLI